MKTGALLFCLLLVLPVSAAAQSAGVASQRVLDPLRDFDPFKAPVTPERYFPDELEQRTRVAIMDALTHRTERLRGHVRYFEDNDKERLARGGNVSGLTHHVRELHHGNLSDRETYRDAQQEALAVAPPGAPQRMIRARLGRDELERAESLVAEHRIGRWNALLNRLLASVDLITLASGSYVTAAVETAFVEMQRTRAPRMPEAERRALALYKRFLDRFPDDPRNTELAEKVTALEADRRGLWIHKHLTRAREALDEGRIEDAEFHAELAAVVDPEADDVEERFREIDEARATREESRRRQLSVAETDTLSDAGPAQSKDVRSLLYALAKGDAASAMERARDLERRYAGEPLAAWAKDARAVAQELNGRHEEAKRTLEEIARSSSSARHKERARILLDSPEYNLLDVLDRARTRYRLEQVRFVLLGRNFLEKNVLIGAAPVITHGVAGAATLGTANILIVSSNLLEMLSGNPVSDQAVMDAAARYVRFRTDSKESGDVYEVLGKAYESKGHLHKALYYHRLSGKLSAEQIRELEEKAGRTLLKAAEENASEARQRTLYAAILQHYPDTPAGEKAKGLLARLVSVKSRGLRLSKQFLTENPQLYGPQGLGLKTALFDGRVNNMELAGNGLNILGRNTIMLHYDTPWGVRTRTYSVSERRIEGLESLLREKHYELAVEGVDERDGNGAGGLKDFPARLMQVGTAERRPDDADLQFVRRTGRAADPRSPILDHRLLSEKESDPQRALGLPTVRGSVTASGVSMRADAPKSFLADELTVGNDSVSPYAGVRLPIPLLKDFIPVDFMLRARPGLPSLTPQIRKPKTSVDDARLYR